MRIPVWLAWILILSTLLTAGLLRRFHEVTPASPFVSPAVGSLLFVSVLFLLLVTAREWRLGAAPGPGVRLGSITPLMLMLLVEKWASISLYNPIFAFAHPSHQPELLVDARYRAFAGAGLLAISILVAAFSRPTARRAWAMARPGRLVPAAAGAAAAVAGAYAILAAVSTAAGGASSVAWPAITPLWLWIVAGQSLRSFSEEVYYRGILMSELGRLGPRLGIRSAAGRRWAALGPTSILFAMEHVTLASTLEESLRLAAFSLSLGVLLGMMVLLTDNLHFSAAVHAWINALLLGAMPRITDAQGAAPLPSSITIALALVLSFGAAALLRRHTSGRRAAAGGDGAFSSGR